MSSIRQQVLDEIVSMLKTNSAYARPNGLRTHRMLQVPIDADELPAIVVYPMQFTPFGVGEGGHVDTNLNQLVVRLECRAKISPSQSPDEAIEPLLVYAQKVIKSDESLGGIASICTEGGIQYDFEIAEAGFAAAAYDWTVDFFTDEQDPEAQ